MVRRAVQLVLSCALLGVGIALLLDAALGSDGYSTLINGLRLALDQPFWLVNLVVAIVFVALAWVRGVRPGAGTIVQPVVVGFVVSWVRAVEPDPSSYAGRGVELAVAFPVVCLGVAGYLASQLGAGPTEGAALAWDPPLPFRWTYTVLQLSSALIGWALGADIGVGTAVVVVLAGPTVDLLTRAIFGTTTSQRRPRPDGGGAG